MCHAPLVPIPEPVPDRAVVTEPSARLTGSDS
jgi:hypothetical protein